MKMNLRMPQEFKSEYKKEIQNFKIAQHLKDIPKAWKHLERAHIIGQYHPISHTGIHFRMLIYALYLRDGKETMGQMPRFLFGWIGSLFNRIPVGNIGTAKVPIFAPMPIPEDLRDLLSAADTTSKGLSGLIR